MWWQWWRWRWWHNQSRYDSGDLHSDRVWQFRCTLSNNGHGHAHRAIANIQTGCAGSKAGDSPSANGLLGQSRLRYTRIV
jgi:hypothetical protein